MYHHELGRIKPSFESAIYNTAAVHTILPPAGEGQEWNIASIDITAAASGANSITVKMGSNVVRVDELAVAGDYRSRKPEPMWRCGDNQPLTITLSAALGVRVNIEYYKLPAYA
jgi:hypothetical protein